MAVTRAGNAIRMTADADVVAHAVRCNSVVVDNAGAVTFHVRLRKGSVSGAVVLEAHVPVAIGTFIAEAISVPAAGVYLEIVAGTGSVTLLSE